jgi:hypothetical protein
MGENYFSSAIFRVASVQTTHMCCSNAGFPLILLLVILGRAVTLEGSQDGIATYLKCDWSVLIDKPEVWVKAVRFA